MRLIRFEDENGVIHLGEPVDEGMARVVEGDLFGQLQPTSETVAIHRLLAPLAPPNIIAIGRNYSAHAAEGGAEVPKEPLVFAKLTSSVIADGDPIVLPASAPDEVDFEAELAVIVGKPAHRVAREDALDHVLGYTCADDDFSARDCQKHRDKQWTRGKSFDTYCPFGPAVVVDPELRCDELSVRSVLNGETMQDSNTRHMMFPVVELIHFLSHQFTLLPGTVILTGTPEGVGFARTPPRFLRPGDEITVEVEGVGTLTNPVRAPLE